MYAETRIRHKYFYLTCTALVQFRHSIGIRDFPNWSCASPVSQNRAMEESALTSVEDLALAQAMVRVWGPEAALKASDNACTQAFMGNDATAQKWQRVMRLIAAVRKADPKCATDSGTAS
jgi:hypothetical protein